MIATYPMHVTSSAADHSVRDESVLRNWEQYTEQFRTVFHRGDRYALFRAYLQGLLEPSVRKTVEAIAAAHPRQGLAQSLNHFVSVSPWSSGDLLRVLRQQNRLRRNDRQAVWVVHDVAFPKKGKRTVGVLRQFAREAGKKVNCQIGVFITQVGPNGVFPLNARLYLPVGWLKENAETTVKTLPPEQQAFASKHTIALKLLDELCADDLQRPPVVVEKAYATQDEFVASIAERGFAIADHETNSMELVSEAFAQMRSTLGLDHFEGRTWTGWHHHVSLVFTAFEWLQQLRSE